MKGYMKLFRVALILFVLASLAFISPQTHRVQATGTSATVVYNLFATDAFIKMADGETIYNYGFVGGRAGQTNVQFQQSVGVGGTNYANTTLASGWPNPTPGPITAAEQPMLGNAQFPAPVIYAKVNDVVQINLKNLGVTHPGAPNDPHSIHLHGMDVNAANDGVPETSVGAIPATSGVPGAGNIVVYMFTPKVAGTYMYHCHQEAQIHVQMGMYGAMVIYNATDTGATKGPNTGPGTEHGFQYDRDYVLLLSDIDPPGHEAEQGLSDDYNWADYQPNYWFINGLSFPQTIHAGFPEGYSWEQWIAAHPGYDPLIQGSVSKANAYWRTKGEKLLIRVINMGFEAQPMHMHGYHGKVISTDQRAITWGNSPKIGFSQATVFGKGFEKQTLLVGSGETYDWLIDMGQQTLFSTYDPGAQTRYDPNTNLPASNTETGKPVIVWDGDAYQGGPQVGQLFPFHNHDDYKATNNGVYPGGMFTMIMATQ